MSCLASQAVYRRGERRRTKAVSAVFEAVQDCLARGESVGVTGFGTFSTKIRQGRIGKSPRTGERIAIAASRGPAFKVCRTHRDVVNWRYAGCSGRRHASRCATTGQVAGQTSQAASARTVPDKRFVTCTDGTSPQPHRWTKDDAARRVGARRMCFCRVSNGR